MFPLLRRPPRATGRARRPAATVLAGFAAAAAAGTLALMLPVASATGPATGFVPAVFTAVSAVTVTGLIVVDTPTHWSAFGELVILVLVQVGGIGVITSATLLGLLISRRVRLRRQLSAQAESRSSGPGEVRHVVGGVIAVSLAVEALVAAPLVLRFAAHYDEPAGRALYLGAFHAVSAFNNAGFALFTENLMPFAGDPWICGPLAVATLVGGVGFPVLFELGRRLRGRSRRWSLHLRITVGTYAVLLAVGVTAFLIAEWRNPGTLGPMSVGGKLVAGCFQGVMPLTAGFNSVDPGRTYPGTLLVTDVLMFIGGGSGGTAGGIKVTTFALLAFVMLAEARGEPTVHVLGRRLPATVQRQALTVALSGIGVVVVSTMTLLAITPFGLDAVLFETVSAFGTAGLSTGITADLPIGGQLLLTALMFLGRLGPITLASALALRERGRRYELPEERVIVG